MKYIFLFVLLLPLTSLADDKVIRIYQDADLTSHIESSEAIQKGIEVAFDEIGNEIDGFKIEFKYLDHRGNVVRSKKNYIEFLADDRALAMYSGIHSPPLIKNRQFINENKALTLVPWAAGGPITRYPSKENWVFRLSVDDTRAGPVIIDFAMKNKACKKPSLLLESTPWGDSNFKSMSKALLNYGIPNPDRTKFGLSLKSKAAQTMIRKIIENDNDCIVFVGNAVEGTVIAEAMLNFPVENRIPIISHWGIVGGNFHEKVTAEKRSGLDLHFIQSCFAFTNDSQTDFSDAVFKRLQSLDEEIEKPGDLKSAVGFIHAYDLTKLLIQAIKQAGISGDIGKDRDEVRLALENINTPLEGLVKNYNKPFSVFDAQNNNAHEALHSDSYCMGYFGEQDQVLITK